MKIATTQILDTSDCETINKADIKIKTYLVACFLTKWSNAPLPVEDKKLLINLVRNSRISDFEVTLLEKSSCGDTYAIALQIDTYAIALQMDTHIIAQIALDLLVQAYPEDDWQLGD